MLKEIILKCARFLNRDDIVKSLLSDDFSLNNNETNTGDIVLLINCYNNVTISLCENLSSLVFCEKIMTDSTGKISYDHFSRTPTHIKFVQNDSGTKIDFSQNAFFVQTNLPSKLLSVTYNFSPKPVFDLTDKTDFVPKIYDNAVCYGIIAEFLDAKSKYTESEIWKKKFSAEMFNFKTKGERRVKSSYFV